MKRRRSQKDYATPGSLRAARMAAQSKLAGRWQEIVDAARELAEARRGWYNPTGIKRWYVPGPQTEGTVLTPYAAKERRRRRVVRRIAHESRRRNFHVS